MATLSNFELKEVNSNESYWAVRSYTAMLTALCTVDLSFESVNEILSVIFLMKTTRQYFLVLLFILLNCVGLYT